MPTRPLLSRGHAGWFLIGAAWALAAPHVAAQQRTAEERAATLEELAAEATPAVVLIDVNTAVDTRQGSGFVVDPSGRILTNYHVIRDAESARVKLSNGDIYEEVEVLAEDARRDIAIIQIAGFNLPYLELGNSDSVRIGAPVVLIGSPLGLENTVSTGIVSGRRQEPEGFQLLQISAPASRGSSGGAMLNSDGRVVGIAVSQIEQGQNLNFALPINYARGLLQHVSDTPVAVLRPASRSTGEAPERRPTGLAEAVNQGLSYRIEGFNGYRIETEAQLEGGRTRRTRTIYRLIETIGSSEPQIEQYTESETTRLTGPFATVQTLQRERSRVVMRAGGLRPVSALGETATWNGSTWVAAEHDLRFEGDRVVGLVTDTAGRTIELDRALPSGIVLSEVTPLAFALLEADSLIGRGVEFVTFEPRQNKIGHVRYDIRDDAEIQVSGEDYRALRINVATGLNNATLFVRSERPRVFLRRVNGDGSQVEEVTALEVYTRRGAADEASAAAIERSMAWGLRLMRPSVGDASGRDPRGK